MIGNKNLIDWCCLLIAIFLFNTCLGQSKKFIHINVNDGLSQNSVVDLVQDTFGYIWLATQDGLNRYDGNSFKYYRKYFDDITRPTFSKLGRVYKDDYNQIWVIKEGGEVEYFDYKNNRFNQLDSLRNISCIIQLNPNEMLLGSYGNGVYKINLPSLKITHFLLPKKVDIYNILVDNKEIILCTNQGVKKPNIDFLLTKNFLDHLRVSDIVRGDSLFYISTYGQGLWSTDINFKNPKQVLQDLNIEDIHIDSQGQLWVATYGNGLWKMSKNNIWEHFESKSTNFNSISYNDLLSILEDREGNLWIGTDGGGVSIYSPKFNSFNSITNFDTPAGISVDVPRAICLDENDNIWIGTSGKGLTSFNRYTQEFKSYIQLISDQRILSLLHDEDELWIGTQESGLYKFDIKQNQMLEITELSDVAIWDLVKVNSDLLLCTNKPYIILYNTITKAEIYKALPKGISFPRVSFMANKVVYFGCDQGEIFQWNPENDEIIILDENYKNEYGSIKSLNMINGKLWVGTQKAGIVILDSLGSKTFNLDISTGMPNNTVYSIQHSKKSKEVWVSTNSGIAKISDQISLIEIKKEDINVFTKDDGLINNEFNTGAYFQDNDGVIYLGALNGVLWFDPNEIVKNGQTTSAYIEKLSYVSSDKNVIIDNALCITNFTLPVGVRDFQVEFSNPQLSFSESYYTYRLSPYQQDWINNGSTATFSNLDPGTYELELKMNDESQIADVIKLEVPKYWYELLITRVLFYILLLTLFAYLLITYRLRLKLRAKLFEEATEAEKNREIMESRKKFFTNVTHEFRTPLTVINGLISQKDLSQEKRSIILRNSNNLLRLVNQIMVYSKAEAGIEKYEMEELNLVNLIKMLVDSFDSLAAVKDIELNATYAFNEIYSVVDFQKLKIALSNIIANAIKYTKHNDTILISCLVVNEEVQINITDHGNGIPIEYQERIFERYFRVNEELNMGTGLGLAISKTYVENMDGDISMRSKKNEGTTFTIKLPYISKQSFVQKEQSQLNTISLSDSPVILIVEDNLDLQNYLKSILSKDYQLLIAANGLDGKNIASEKLPDLIISDVIMPELDGLSMVDQLKKNILTSHIPIIMLTAKVALDDRLKGLSKGAIAYLTKPFESEELLSLLNSIFRDRKEIIAYYEKNECLPFDQKHEDLFLAKVKKLIGDHMADQQFNIQLLSTHLQMDRSQIFRKLKSLTGKSTKQIILEARMKKAKTLLLKTDYTLAQIAYECGYSDPSYFSKVFKKFTGKSPSEFN